MPVFEFKIEVSLGAVPVIEDLLAEHEEQRLMVMEDKPSGRAWLTGYFESRSEALQVWKGFAANFESGWLLSQLGLRELADEDWKESYKIHFKAWQFGLLHWVPVWERDTFKLPPGEQVLWLDPGMAFGTGNHETTRLVVERLVSLYDLRGAGGRVIDAGCGSGILALSAAKLGYRELVAFDNDPVAVEVSKENAAMNGMDGRVHFFTGDLVSGLSGRQAELVLANIQADVLTLFQNELLGSVAPKGTIVLSGILAQELAQVRDVFAAAAPGWVIDSRIMGEWSDLVLTRP